MGHVPVAKGSPIPRGWKFPKRGLAIVLILLGIFAVGGVMLATAWPTGGNVDQSTHGTWVSVAKADDLQVDEPLRSIEHKLWLVKLDTGEILALWTRDPRLGCTVPWRPDFKFKGITGWFRNPCHSQTYDLTGTCFDGPCIRGLDRFETRIVNGRIEAKVGPGAAIEGPPVDFGKPVYIPVSQR